MPKLKTRKALKLRIRVTKNGKLKRCKAGRRHLLSGKSSKRKRKMRKPAWVKVKFIKTYKRGLVQ